MPELTREMEAKIRKRCATLVFYYTPAEEAWWRSQGNRMLAEIDRLRARIAEVEQERDRLRAALAWALPRTSIQYHWDEGGEVSCAAAPPCRPKIGAADVDSAEWEADMQAYKDAMESEFPHAPDCPLLQARNAARAALTRPPKEAPNA